MLEEELVLLVVSGLLEELDVVEDVVELELTEETGLLEELDFSEELDLSAEELGAVMNELSTSELVTGFPGYLFVVEELDELEELDLLLEELVLDELFELDEELLLDELLELSEPGSPVLEPPGMPPGTSCEFSGTVPDISEPETDALPASTIVMESGISSSLREHPESTQAAITKETAHFILFFIMYFPTIKYLSVGTL